MSENVLVVGGGITGVATADRLAELGFRVTVLDARGIGGEATRRNQGWLHSGAWFAPVNEGLARGCHAALVRTIESHPTSIEPGHEGMLFLIPRDETAEWTDAWRATDIPFAPHPASFVEIRVPGLRCVDHHEVFVLPDRSVNFDVLVQELADSAAGRGVEFEIGRRVERLLVRDESVVAVETADGERIDASFVVLAGNARGMNLLQSICGDEPGGQPPYEWVAVKSHLVEIELDRRYWPFCVVDEEGFHHVPHERGSVFGQHRWNPVRDPLDRAVETDEVERLRERIGTFLPDVADRPHECWAGTTMQAMHDDQVVPGSAPLPTVLDHATLPQPVGNLVSIFPGRASLWNDVADQVGRLLAQRRDA